MYTLADLYKSLALSVLNNTGIVTDDMRDVDDDKKDYILEFIRKGMTRLHSRFVLRSNQIYLEMHEGRTNYPLRKQYAYMSYDPEKEQYPFIFDTPAHPFEGDVLKILNVFDNMGHRRILNDNNDTHGLFTPRPDTLQCIRPRHGETLSVVYQASHPPLTGDVNQEIDLPETLHSALEYWVAYSYYTGLNTAESTGKAAEYLQMYESICKEVEDFDLVNGSSSQTNTLFKLRGWV